MDAERCICCGEIIPEGRQICYLCERGENMAHRKNSEGYSDPTAFLAEAKIEREQSRSEKALERKMSNAIKALKLVAELAGFEIVGRICLKHKSTGKEFK